ncbi:molecular chaperone DnaK [Aliivibrio fischeri]|uniref:molecular chaperone DnaK n=1 Tax=Aliivibrio fischeri TaxID=668 RepID=UPI0012DA8301|nr:molecular chaperone DnaK [Aliivibrio fischeri]MUL11057.1 molecular chaperone DnaK [Aliivibrio fischeri]MUL13205.1 molecular chaperone DnaK [Aliivibrio fischeri]
MNTKRITEWKLSNKTAQQIGVDASFEKMVGNLEDTIQKEISAFVNGITTLCNQTPLMNALNTCFSEVESEFNAVRWVSFDGDIYFDKQAKGFWLLSEETIKSFNQGSHFQSGESYDEVIEIVNAILGDELNEWDVPDFDTLKKLTNLSNTPFPISSTGRVNFNAYHLYQIENYVQGFDCDSGYLKNKDHGYCLPYLPQADFSNLGNKEIFINAIFSGFIPIKLKNNALYKALIVALNYKKKIYVEEMENHFDILNQMVIQKITNSLLLEDSIRADMAPYHSKIVEDTELGHWSLWTDELEGTNEQAISLPIPMVARDPKSSINDGVVGIDFGTKSTVVVYQKDNVNIHPMRVGTGDLSTDIQAYHYENPTIMEFKDLEAFITAYDGKANKPYTRWQDLTISHTAKNSMEGTESSQFNTFLDEIKQWAGDKNRKLKIVGQKGKIIDLPPFLELTDDDFNPIEIYAYYLGLYINNLNNGIFMEYILSFPVTYEMPIRDKIIASFEKGLKKSLPAELGTENIDQLTVTKGASEPAAYALTAFKSHDFDPQGDERIFYSVFDFGGGTTDFDFGIFRESKGGKERRFDYVIEHFGAGGDQFLGGENLLELLAFEVFKKNKSKLLKQGIQFEKHPEKDAFAGSEQLLSHSQEARNNTKKLCIALRPFWEEHEDFTIDASGELSITLTDIQGVQHSGFALDIDEEELKQLLSDRIERGVENFFNALRLAFSNSQESLGDIDSVKIFLAGNSSQSSFVNALFEKHIALQDEAIGNQTGQSHFELFAPLGADKNDVEKPTGKTGVAFGLIESREGGNIMVIDRNLADNDIRFKFYLGENRKGKFKPVIDREMRFNQWVEFIDAGYQKFELFYTDQPTSSTGNVAISDSSIKKKTIKLDMTDDDALVYIRIVSPTTIEYVIANENDIENNVYLNRIQSLEF